MGGILLGMVFIESVDLRSEGGGRGFGRIVRVEIRSSNSIMGWVIFRVCFGCDLVGFWVLRN
jgi:hypothetical protein